MDVFAGSKTIEELDESAFFKMSLNFFCIIGQDGYFKKVNSVGSKLLGWDCQELISRPWIEFVHPDDVAYSLLADRQCQDEDNIRLESRYLHQDGSYRWLSWTRSRYQQGLSYAELHDITPLQQANEQLKSELAECRQVQQALRPETIYRTLLENA